MDLLDQLRTNKGTVASVLGKEFAEKVLNGDKSILEQAIEYVSYDLDNQNQKEFEQGLQRF